MVGRDGVRQGLAQTQEQSEKVLMSKQGDPGKAAVASDEWKPRSRARKRVRPFTIEYRWRLWRDKYWSEWRVWAKYETAELRDYNLDKKLREGSGRWMEVRKGNP